MAHLNSHCTYQLVGTVSNVCMNWWTHSSSSISFPFKMATHIYIFIKGDFFPHYDLEYLLNSMQILLSSFIYLDLTLTCFVYVSPTVLFGYPSKQYLGVEFSNTPAPIPWIPLIIIELLTSHQISVAPKLQILLVDIFCYLHALPSWYFIQPMFPIF